MKELIIQHLESMCDSPSDLEIVSAEAIDNDAMFIHFTFDGETQAAVYYPADDILYTPTDWQSGYPHHADEIADYQWQTSAGDEAIVMDGLPRAFAAVRDDARKAFGARVRSLREARGLQQDELARLAGLQRPNLARIESGRYNVTLDTITRLSAALGTTLAGLGDGI